MVRQVEMRSWNVLKKQKLTAVHAMYCTCVRRVHDDKWAREWKCISHSCNKDLQGCNVLHIVTAYTINFYSSRSPCACVCWCVVTSQRRSHNYDIVSQLTACHKRSESTITRSPSLWRDANGQNTFVFMHLHFIFWLLDWQLKFYLFINCLHSEEGIECYAV